MRLDIGQDYTAVTFSNFLEYVLLVILFWWAIIEMSKGQTRRKAGTQSHGSHGGVGSPDRRNYYFFGVFVFLGGATIYN